VARLLRFKKVLQDRPTSPVIGLPERELDNEDRRSTPYNVNENVRQKQCTVPFSNRNAITGASNEGSDYTVCLAWLSFNFKACDPSFSASFSAGHTYALQVFSKTCQRGPSSRLQTLRLKFKKIKISNKELLPQVGRRQVTRILLAYVKWL